MTKGEEFIEKAETVLRMRIGSIIASSILKNNLAKLKKDAKGLTAEDYKVLVENIVKASSLFETQGESKLIQSDLEALLKAFS